MRNPLRRKYSVVWLEVEQGRYYLYCSAEKSAKRIIDFFHMHGVAPRYPWIPSIRLIP